MSTVVGTRAEQLTGVASCIVLCCDFERQRERPVGPPRSAAAATETVHVLLAYGAPQGGTRPTQLCGASGTGRATLLVHVT
eukprot:2834223-Prymnesium_polylepis.1